MGKRADASPAASFYVYELADPRTGAAFYVGKGKGRRAWAHEGAARSGRERNGLKSEAIRQIHRAGLRPVVRIVHDGLSERDAFRIERDLIAAHRHELTNIVAGSRTALECIQADVREGLREMKPLCALIREGASVERLRLWARIRTSLARVYVGAAA